MIDVFTDPHINRNLQGFEGDIYLKDEVLRLVVKFDISSIIETGTFLGGTTKQFADIVRHVFTIESNQDFFQKAKNNLRGLENILMIYGKSEDRLLETIKIATGNILFWLDAHWEDNCPLLNELAIIAESGISPIICIHDFKVPASDFGYDSYNGNNLDYDYIKESLERIYNSNFTYYYNTIAIGARQGCIFITPNV